MYYTGTGIPILSVGSESWSPQTPLISWKNVIFFHLLKSFYLQAFLELEAHIFKFGRSDAETFKNTLFLLDFKNKYPTPYVPEGRKILFFAVDIYIPYRPIPYMNVNGEKSHLITFVYERRGVPIFKILRKECIFERFSIWKKKLWKYELLTPKTLEVRIKSTLILSVLYVKKMIIILQGTSWTNT